VSGGAPAGGRGSTGGVARSRPDDGGAVGMPSGDAGRPLDVLAIGAHPDDVELGCGGTLAKLAAAGRRVGILHLTGGESGTRGTVALRRREAEAAAAALGAVEVTILDCGDGGLRTGAAEEDAVLAVLRRLRPEVVLAPPASDRHPDHGRGHDLALAACFYAGLAGRRLAGPAAGLAPHRPAAVFHYMQHDPFEPDFVVDVSAHWQTRRAALACYGSQLHPALGGSEEDGESAGPPTKVGSRQFALALEGRARHFGLLIGADHGEPFASRLPLAVDDLLAVVPGGIR
jgi:N-acetylglucosamine malate deacetylase 1